MMRLTKPVMVSAVAALLSLVPAAASAVTLKEIVQLSRAGLGDEVLLALIEIDQRVFSIDPDTLRMLKEQGVSERVIVALIRSGRTQPAVEQMMVPPVVEAPPPAAEPPVVVIERERPVVHQVVVPVPVYVPVVTARPHRRIEDHVDRIEDRRRSVEPVYWGWGGKRRPDSWQDAPAQKHKR